MSMIISIIIALLIAGFVLWALRAILALIPLDPFLKQVIDVLVLVVVVAIVLFYVVIPLVSMLGHLSIPALRG